MSLLRQMNDTITYTFACINPLSQSCSRSVGSCLTSTFFLTWYGYTGWTFQAKYRCKVPCRDWEGYYLKPVCDPSIELVAPSNPSDLLAPKEGERAGRARDGWSVQRKEVGFQRNIYRVDIEIDGRYLRHANPTSERISDNARRRPKK